VPKPLPKKLANEPLVDAVCEVRVRSQVDLHTILPGLLYSQLGGVGKVEQMPAMSIPEHLRSGRPEFQLTNNSLMRIHWGAYFVTVGTRNVVIGPRLPYRGWGDFRENALKVFQLLLANPFVEAVERYSTKYVNLVPAQQLAEQHNVLDWDIRIGPHRIVGQGTQLRTELRNAQYITIIQLSTGIAIEMVDSKETRIGSLIDVDTLCNDLHLDVKQFLAELPKRLDHIRHENKVVFFDCLRDSVIEAMGPTYE
jgi:uncharacterized protein (TIGR04255 family)